MEFSLSAEDEKGKASTKSDIVTTTIRAVNQPPIADAGPDQTVNGGDNVTLDSTASYDLDGNLKSYSWRQIGVPAVVLDDHNSTLASFIAPNITSDTQLKFLLMVEDDDGTSSSMASTTSVIIKPNSLTTANLLTNIGINQSIRGNYSRAIEYYDKALAVEPNYVSALANKGLALNSLERYYEAIEYFDKALAVEPNHVNALTNKGLALNSLERYDEAIEYFDKALAVEPNHVNALTNKGLALIAWRDTMKLRGL